MNDTDQTFIRAKCSGHEGYRNGRAHLIDLDRLVDPRDMWTGQPLDMERIERFVKGKLRFDSRFSATGPCPVCGMGGHSRFDELGPADRKNGYTIAGVRGTPMPKPCNASCMQSASAECKCSCGGADHGMYA